MTCFCFPDQRQMKENCGVRETGEMVETARASQPVGSIAASTCISSLSGNISLVLLSAIKALSNLGAG